MTISTSLNPSLIDLLLTSFSPSPHMTPLKTLYAPLNLLLSPLLWPTPSLYLWCTQNSKLGLTTLTKPIPKRDRCGNLPLAICKPCGRVKSHCKPRGGLKGEFSPTIEKYSPFLEFHSNNRTILIRTVDLLYICRAVSYYTQ